MTLYDIGDINLINSNSFNDITKTIFFITFASFTVLIVLSLIVWKIGIIIKSEKTIKFGIKSFAISIIVQLFIMLIPILINFARNNF